MKKYRSALYALALVATGIVAHVSWKHVSSDPARDIASRYAKKIHASNIKLDSLEKVQSYVQEHDLYEVEYQGMLIKEDADFFHTSFHVERYFVENHRERIQIEPTNPEKLSSLIGKEVLVSGWKDQNTDRNFGFVSRDKDLVLENAPLSNKASSVKAEKIIIVLADYLDSVPRPQSPNYVNANNIAEFLNTKTFQTFFDFHYQGKIRNKVTKVVEYKFARNCEDKKFPGHPNAWGYVDYDDINQVFRDLKLDEKDFTNVSVFSNCNWTGAWGVASGVNINGKYLTSSNLTLWPSYYTYGSPENNVPYLPTYDESWSFLSVYIHERLHNFGHPHANGLECGITPLLVSCTHKEYHNPFDVMGGMYPGFQVNAHQMNTLKILPESKFLTITTPGIYTISSLDNFKQGPIAAYIKIPEIHEPVFMVEHRVPAGFNQNLIKPKYKDIIRGLLLYSSINPYYGYADYSTQFRIIDPYPTIRNRSLPTFNDRVSSRGILPEMDYFDPLTGVTIKVLQTESGKNGSTITFKVDFDSQKRDCLKTSLRNIVSDFNFEVNTVQFSSDDIVTVRPRDTLNIRARIQQIEPTYCPKIKFKTSVKNTTMLSPWINDKYNPPGEYIGPKKEGPQLIYSFDNSWVNMNFETLLTPGMVVPDDAPDGYYEFPVFYSNLATGEEFESILRLQIEKE